MSDNNQKNESDLTQEQAIAGYKFFMALQEIDKQNKLDVLFEALKVGPNNAQYGSEEAIQRFSNDFDPKNAKENLKIVESKFPDIYAAITAEVDQADLTKTLSNNGLKEADFDSSAVHVMKTVKAFEGRFPGGSSPSLSKRLGLIKDSLLEAKNTTNGKIVFNTVMLGVALGTGGIGALAGIKLAMAVGEKLMTNKKVADLAGSVTAKVNEYMKDTLCIPTDEIRAGFEKVKNKANGNQYLRFAVLGLAAIAAIGGLGSMLTHGHMIDMAKDFASGHVDHGVDSMGFNSVGHADAAGSIQAPGDGTIPAPSGNGVELPTNETIPAPTDAGVGGALPPSASPSEIGVGDPAYSDLSSASLSDHVVSKNESLWKISHQLLGEDASDHDIAKGVKSLIEANQHIANPDLIYPGDVVKIPSDFGHNLPGVDVGALKASVDASILNPMSVQHVDFPSGPSGLDVSALKASVDASVLDPMASPVVSFPAVADVSHVADGSIHNASGVDVGHMKTAIDPSTMDPTAISAEVNYPSSGFDTTEIKPNTGTGSKFAEMVKTTAPSPVPVTIKPPSKGFELNLG